MRSILRQETASQPAMVSGHTPAPAWHVDDARAHHAGGLDDAFFRQIVTGMRNGVLAITRDGRLAVINDEAYRLFGITAQPADIGQPAATVLKSHPEVLRTLTAAFELHHLPNRAEMRLKPHNQ